MKTCLMVVVLCVFSLGAFADDVTEVTLGTNVLSKKSQAVTQVEGGSVEHVKCILDQMHVKYQIRSLPWRRARKDVHSSVIDGFFTAVSIDEANDYATFSAPLVLENWYWFWRTDMAVPASWKQHFQVGVILGSQQESILTNEGYTDFVTANSVEQLIKLLFSKRVDVLLMDKEQFETAAKKLAVQNREYKSRFFRYVPLGVYFGGPFLAQHPDFLTAFNNRIANCASADFGLAASEKETIQKLLAPWFQRVRTNKDILSAVAKQNALNKTKSQNQLNQIDEQWQLAFKVGNLNFPKSIVSQPASQIVEQIQAKSNDLLSEIIVMDALGYNVAIANMTSDYWQGDEDKFIQVSNKPAATMYFDNIRYDASAKRFQVQVSAPLIDPQTQKNIGAVMLGVDVDKALSLQN